DLFPVTRILGQRLVEVSPGIVGCTKNLPLLLDRLREKNAHRVRQVADYLRLDAVSCHLEKAPVPAGGINGVKARGALEFGNIDYGYSVGHTGLRALRRFSRLQPLRKQRIRVDLDRRVKWDSAFPQPLLKFAALHRVEDLGTAADVLAAHENLGDRADAQPRRQHRAELPAAVSFLVLNRVQVDTSVVHPKLAEELAHGPAEFAPVQGEQDHLLPSQDIVNEAHRLGI